MQFSAFQSARNYASAMSGAIGSRDFNFPRQVPTRYSTTKKWQNRDNTRDKRKLAERKDFRQQVLGVEFRAVLVETFDC